MEDRIIVDSILKDGRKNLFSLIVKSYGGMVFSRALGITKNAELAKDVAQQTFIRAFTRLDSWNGKELGPWLTTIASHQALNLLEKEKRKSTVSLEAAPLPDEEYSEERERRLQRMEHAISRLSEQDQQIIRLHYYQKVKTDEIARQLNLSQANILVRLHRIRERLKKQLQDEDE
ncbi:MAG: sigma-70 family RNA polymerase sigma factor [Prevotella sp.]|nr:sigma-70 family RNA polymerase sigma factor [Prevotella sp.]